VENYSIVQVLWLSSSFRNSLRSVVVPDTYTNDLAQSSEWKWGGLERPIFKGDVLSGEEQDRHDGWRNQHFPLSFSHFEKGFSVISRVFLEEPHPPKSKSQKQLWDGFAHMCTDIVRAVTVMGSSREHSHPGPMCHSFLWHQQTLSSRSVAML